MMDDVLYVSVAGINFRASDEDVGPILGYTKANPVDVDPEAEGVFLQSGKLIGFIPVRRREEFKEFKKEAQNSEGACLFSGNIKKIQKKDGSYYIGNIALVKGDAMKTLLQAHYNGDFDLFGQKRPTL
jgi:hypothetical protein